MTHKAGFVNILGKPNAGKSTLMNRLVGEKLSIVTPKAQTTRHRILGIVSQPEYQIVFSDTPGYLEAKYGLHRAMMRFVESAIEDADVILYLIDVTDPSDVESYRQEILQADTKLIVVLNKVDQMQPEQLEPLVKEWQALAPQAKVLPMSAELGFNADLLMQYIVELLPEGESYYGEDELTDKSERFLAAEIIREKVFLNYKQEIPYASEVLVDTFKDEPNLLRIEATVYVERPTQKGIIIGHQGKELKKVGTAARLDMEKFWDKKVYLGLFVKVKENWRNDDRQLRYFGYKSGS
ncbi:MAG: GTPase Era [Sphingobacteriaceae bacterium]|nr:GTPase Era [Sphingobacteriaceae bacterium]